MYIFYIVIYKKKVQFVVNVVNENREYHNRNSV